MKLNVDCVRSVLLEVEEVPYGKEAHLGDLIGALGKDYSYEDICYSILKLNEAGYIKAKIANSITGTSIISVSDITYAGHQFLANIRTHKVWSATKSVMGKIGATSIHAATEIATSVVTELIKQAILPSI